MTTLIEDLKDLVEQFEMKKIDRGQLITALATITNYYQREDTKKNG